MKSFLFLIGLPKSGTTYLRNLLNAHPAISLGMEEANKLIRIHGTSHPDRLAECYTKVLSRISKFKAGLHYGGDKVLWDESLESLPPETLFTSKAKYLLLVRDPRDRLISARYHMISRDRRSPPGAFYPLWNVPLVEIRWWREVLPHFNKMDSREVIYERLVCDPDTVVREILDFLTLDATNAVIRKMIQAAKARVPRAYGLNPFRKGTPGAWRKKLLPDEGEKIQAALGDILVGRGYESRPDWPYTSLRRLSAFFWTHGLFRHFSRPDCRAFWGWVKDHGSSIPLLRRWFRAMLNYEDPWMFREYYPIRRLPIPITCQRWLACGMYALRKLRK